MRYRFRMRRSLLLACAILTACGDSNHGSDAGSDGGAGAAGDLAMQPATSPDAPGAGPPTTRTPPTPTGSAYYVATTGSGGACTQAAPCRQISDAVTLVHPGDVIFVGDGTYAAFTVDGLDGTAAAPITIYAQGTGANVSAGTRDSISINNSFYIIVDGLNASGAARAGVGVVCSNHVTIRNGRFTANATWGIFSGFADDLVVEHNELAASATQHGVYASNSADRPIIRANLVHDNAASGIQINADGTVDPASDCAWLTAGGIKDGICTGAIVEGNVIHGNGAGGAAAINLDGVQQSIVRNNILYDNHATGIVNYMGDGSAGPKGMEILGNTVVQATGARQGLQFLSTTGPSLVRDNILYHPDAGKVGLEFGTAADVANVDSDYNVIDRFTIDSDGTVISLQTFQTMYQLDVHSMSGATPAQLFTSAATGDYSLSSSSPAIGKGVYEADAPTDEAGKPRPTTAPDIGALQH